MYKSWWKYEWILFYLIDYVFDFLANDESMMKIEGDDNEQERYLNNVEKIHSLVQDSYSPLGVILRIEEKTVN